MKQIFTILFLSFLYFNPQAQNLKLTGVPKPKAAIKKYPSQTKNSYQKNSSDKPGRVVNNTDRAIDFNGQWRGGFTDNSSGYVGFSGDKIDYVLEIECQGTEVTGYSYTYFMGGAKRYYTICKLKGTLNKDLKEVTVTEFERTKYNTPPDFRNCFQTHKLKYIKDSDDVEILHGSWFPAPDQSGGCGFGSTTLMRKLLRPLLIANTKPAAKETIKNSLIKNLNKPARPGLVIKPKTYPSAQTKKPLASVPKPGIKNSISQNDQDIKNNIPIIAAPQIKNESKIISAPPSFEKRFKSLLKTIEIEKDTFTVQLYDNGEIDGDSVSVFFNGSLLVSHKRLSDKPISLTLSLEPDDINELTMYAENLGTIPPNTALMIVTDGSKRYEVRITSDTEKNGTIAFVRKKH